MQSLTDLSLIKPLGEDPLNQLECSLCPRADLAGFDAQHLRNAPLCTLSDTKGCREEKSITVTDVFVNRRRIPEEQVLWLLQNQPWKYADTHQGFSFSDPPKATPPILVVVDVAVVITAP